VVASAGGISSLLQLLVRKYIQRYARANCFRSIVNTFGVYQAFYQTSLPQSRKSSDNSWVATDNLAGLIVFGIIYGFLSGVVVSLPPQVLVRLVPDMRLFGTWISREGAIVSLGESFSRQICTKDQSFTVHFYEHHAILSFDDTLDSRSRGQVKKDLCFGVWVQVEVLGSNKKPLLIEDGKNIRDVHMVPEGAEVALGSRGCGTPIYLRCNDVILSIRFTRKSFGK
jgi:hypothetical protein